MVIVCDAPLDCWLRVGIKKTSLIQVFNATGGIVTISVFSCS